LRLDDEKGLIDTIFNSAIDSLSEDDRKLPQLEHILPMLRRGIGIHHSVRLQGAASASRLIFS